MTNIQKTIPQKCIHYWVDFDSIRFQKKCHHGIDGIFLLHLITILHGTLLFSRKCRKNFKASKATSAPPKKTSIACAASTIRWSWSAWAGQWRAWPRSTKPPASCAPGHRPAFRILWRNTSMVSPTGLCMNSLFTRRNPDQMLCRNCQQTFAKLSGGISS